MSDDPDAGGDRASGDRPADSVVVELQAALREELKEPFGPVYTDAETLLADAGDPVVAVGDIVTYHLLQAGHTPDVALVDGHTKRSAVENEVKAALNDGAFDRELSATNRPGTLSAPLLRALAAAIGDADTTVIVVDGEEDLAALPAIAVAPTGASVVYGQPDEGMVLVTCTGETVAAVGDLLGRMDGDTDRLWALLDDAA